ncbi:hypothetical protein LZ554_009475 [Drepanopeziza brunnea f. sp. 'monogermtubi']|nr:hypothetical protein LZ554_009475 [Drepanopeziza brunnea f. sp. 'monogermtubi']
MNLKSITAMLAAMSLATLTSALPYLDARAMKNLGIAARQNAAASAAGITDVDILQFALTLENLEGAFYSQGFNQFPDSSFMAIGMSTTDLTNLKSVATTENTHVNFLTTAIAGAGFKPVQPCTYNFGFTTAQAMVATAGTLENIGVSAYLGAAPLVAMPTILTAAGEILTVEARHQTLLRTLNKAAAIPSAFDTPLGVRSVFSLAAPLITSCPNGSMLNVTPFPALQMMAPTAMPMAGSNTTQTLMTAGTRLALAANVTGATNCAFTNGGLPGGSVFTPYAGGACTVPQGVSGVTYLHLTSSAPATNVLSDNIVVAGVQVINVS